MSLFVSRYFLKFFYHYGTPEELSSIVSNDENEMVDLTECVNEDGYSKWEDNTEDEETKNEQNQISEWQAGWNITNAIQGMFIVSFPYALLQGGYWTLLSIVVVAFICCYTSQIIVKCLYEEDKYGRVIRMRSSYVDIAAHVWGIRTGKVVLSIAQIIELLMTCILYVLLAGELLYGCFRYSGVGLSTWIIISTIPLLPCAFIQSIRRVSFLSFWCTMTHLIINVIMVAYCFTKVTSWQWNEMQLQINIWTFPISLGVVVFSYTSQIFVPTLEGKMKNRGKFKCMIYTTHITAAVFKCVFAYICFLTWGQATQEVISNNLFPIGFKIVTDLILVIKALLSYPLPYYTTIEIFEQVLFSKNHDTWFPSCANKKNRLKIWAVLLRLSLVVTTMLFAVFIPHFSILMGFVGSFTGTMLSFVWPCYFHLYIHGKTLKWYMKTLNLLVIFLGLFCGGLGMYYSVLALNRALQNLPVDPYSLNN